MVEGEIEEEAKIEDRKEVGLMSQKTSSAIIVDRLVILLGIVTSPQHAENAIRQVTWPEIANRPIANKAWVLRETELPVATGRPGSPMWPVKQAPRGGRSRKPRFATDQ